MPKIKGFMKICEDINRIPILQKRKINRENVS